MFMIIDAHLHLWDRQCGRVDEKPVLRSMREKVISVGKYDR